MSLLDPKYRIEDGSIWIETRWHSDTGECIASAKVGEVAYCVSADHNVATHIVSTFNAESDQLIESVAVCKTHAARKVFGHSDHVYAQSRELAFPGYLGGVR